MFYVFFARHLRKNFKINKYIYICETKVWLILILMITKQGLELMIIFQVWLGKTTSKVAIQRQIKPRRNHEEEDHLKEKSFSRPKLFKISL